MRVLVADDDAKQLRYLADLTRRHRPAWNLVAELLDPAKIPSAIISLDPTICILDVRYSGTTGFDVIRNLEVDCGLIFVTGDPAYAAQAFDHAAIDFLTKPLREDRFEQALQRAEVWVARNPHYTRPVATQPIAQAKWVRVLKGLDLVCAPLTEVRYIQAQRKYTKVIFGEADGILRMGFAAVQALLDPDDFWKVHRGVLVNIRNLAFARRDELGRTVLSFNGRSEKIVVARPYEHLFRDGVG